MNLRAAVGEAYVQLAPLDPEDLSVPERALLPEWASDWHRRRAEAQQAAAEKARSK